MTIFAKRFEYGEQTNRISRLQTSIHAVGKDSGTGGRYCRADGAFCHKDGARRCAAAAQSQPHQDHTQLFGHRGQPPSGKRGGGHP